MSKTIVMGADKAGFALKNEIAAQLSQEGYTILDVTPTEENMADYPVYAHALCQTIQKGEAPLGILICGTGIGMSMAANKHRGIRAAVCGDVFSSTMTRRHNDANVLCLGARVIGSELAKMIVKAFLTEDFEGGRHIPRVAAVNAFDDGE